MIIKRQIQGTSATSSISLVLTASPVVLSGTPKKARLKQLLVSFYGAAADAGAVKAVIPAADVVTGASTFTIRKPCGTGATHQAVEWDFAVEGVNLVYTTGSCTITVSLVTAADAAGANPTVMAATAIWTEEN